LKNRYLKEFRPLWGGFARHLPRLALGTAAGLAAATAAIGLMSLSGWFISAAAAAGLTPAAAHLFNFFLPSIGVRLFAMLRTVARYAERVFSHDATLRVLQDLRVWFYRRLEPLSPAGLWRFRSGDLLNRIVSDIEALDHLYLRALSPAVVAVLVSLLTFWLLCAFDVWMAGTFWMLMVLAGIGVSSWAGCAAGPSGRQIATQSAELRTCAVESLQGLAEILMSGAEAMHLERIRKTQSALLAGQRRMAHIRGISAAAMHLLAGAAVLAALYLGCGLVNSERLPGECLALVILAILAAFESVFSLPAAYQFWSRTRAAGGRLVELVELEPAVRFNASSRLVPTRSDIAFDGVCFRYRPELPWALEEVSFCVSAGRRMAIVGESGAGKSTLVNLLVRFFDPTKGAIKIGGENIRSLSELDLRGLVVVISQQTHLFSASVRANLLIAKPEADDIALWHALDAARLHEFVASLPDGLDTWIGEAGRLISTGQARRLAIARAILKDAPIWVLDEPSEGLDRRTEAELMDSLLEITADKTTLWITHRLMSMECLDDVLVMENGRVVDRGTHAELIARNRRYAGWSAHMR
jgi:ATP-binding cassette, subfamily C, bacterial CydC